MISPVLNELMKLNPPIGLLIQAAMLQAARHGDEDILKVLVKYWPGYYNEIKGAL